MSKKRKAHIRRAHEHSFWTGAKNTPERKLLKKFLPDIEVKEGEVLEDKNDVFKQADDLLMAFFGEDKNKATFKNAKVAWRCQMKERFDRQHECDIPWPMFAAYADMEWDGNIDHEALVHLHQEGLL